MGFCSNKINDCAQKLSIYIEQVRQLEIFNAGIVENNNQLESKVRRLEWQVEELQQYSRNGIYELRGFLKEKIKVFFLLNMSLPLQ